MRGKSSPENALAFYNYVMQSLDHYSKTPADRLMINMAYEYFNTSSSKCIYNLFRKFGAMHQAGKSITVNWYYEDGDTDMREAGEDLCCYFDFQFNFISIPEIVAFGTEQANTTAA